MSAFMAPESSWSLRIRMSLGTEPLEGDLWPFEWIVAAFKLGGVEQNPQDLRIDAGGPPGKPIQRGKHEQAAHQAAKKIERRRDHDAGQKKETWLGSQNCEAFVRRLMHWMECWTGGQHCDSDHG